jgi:hypothetical protein
MGGGAGMSIHDEQEIERLRAVNEKLRAAIANSEQLLGEAVLLLSRAEAWSRGDTRQDFMARRKKLEDRYYNHKN